MRCFQLTSLMFVCTRCPANQEIEIARSAPPSNCRDQRNKTAEWLDIWKADQLSSSQTSNVGIAIINHPLITINGRYKPSKMGSLSVLYPHYNKLKSQMSRGQKVLSFWRRFPGILTRCIHIHSLSLHCTRRNTFRWCLRGLLRTRVLLTRGPFCHPETQNRKKLGSNRTRSNG